MRTCKVCLEEKELSEFPKLPKGYRRRKCNSCNSKYHMNYLKEYPLKKRLTKARDRAKKQSLPCDIKIKHLEEIWTGYCPVFGTKLDRFAKRFEKGGYQLDRIRPELGYVIGNIAWLSDRANRLKDNMTVDEAEMIFKFLKSQEKSNET